LDSPARPLGQNRSVTPGPNPILWTDNTLYALYCYEESALQIGREKKIDTVTASGSAMISDQSQCVYAVVADKQEQKINSLFVFFWFPTNKALKMTNINL